MRNHSLLPLAVLVSTFLGCTGVKAPLDAAITTDAPRRDGDEPAPIDTLPKIGGAGAAVVDAGLKKDSTSWGTRDLASMESSSGAGGGSGGSSGNGMRDIRSMALVKDMGVGTNLGNTLDAVGGETAWGNPMTTQAMIQSIAKAGFKSMRIPVTWRTHFGSAPAYTIDAAWMNRVAEVVDWVLEAGMYAIINLHHDGGEDYNKGAWLRNPASDPAKVLVQFKALWAQISDRFINYSDYLVFESMNEVGFADSPAQADYDRLNNLNQEFVTLVRASGGNNRERHLLIASYFTDIDRSIRGVEMPKDDRSILSIHYYTPWQFCINGSPSTWGSSEEIATLKSQFKKLKDTFIDKGIPVILGEYGVSIKTEASSRIYWFEYVAKTSLDMGIAPFLWDPGDQFDRKSLTWRYPGLIDAFKRAASGKDYSITKSP